MRTYSGKFFVQCKVNIVKYLDRPTCLKLANALVFSHMDYCNSLFITLHLTTLAPFQRIQNLTAKIILDGSKYDSTTEALKELHILPIPVRAEYSKLVLVYRCLHGLAVEYILLICSKFIAQVDSPEHPRQNAYTFYAQVLQIDLSVLPVPACGMLFLIGSRISQASLHSRPK